MQFSHSPATLAARVRVQLVRRNLRPPKLAILRRFFETLYFASLRTDEGRPVRVDVVYIDSSNPDPSPPEVLRQDRWSYVRLATPLPFSIQNLVKIALASDPRSSAIAVDVDRRSQLRIWGVLDQQNQFSDFLNYDSDEGPSRPGLFQTSILGLGNIAVYLDYQKLLELRVNEIVGPAIDVFGSPGPIQSLIGSAAVSSIAGRETELPEIDDAWLYWYWSGTLSRILLRANGFRHGGAFLLTATDDPTDLKINYPISYDRLRPALERRLLLARSVETARDRVDRLPHSSPTVPRDDYLTELIGSQDIRNSKAEVDGVVWFISLLSRVDGCVWLTHDLHVRGFGVEITAATEPAAVYLAKNASASGPRLRQVEYRLFGTRHRSMMRYIAKHPRSLGIVVSQDGSIRFLHKFRRKLVMWDNVRLQLHVPSRR